MTRPPFALFVLAWLGALLVGAAPQAGQAKPPTKAQAIDMFKTSDACLACHNGLTTASGEDISIGSDWRGSMMANSSRDPYFQAAVRREAIDHPPAVVEIQDECAKCHMPMSRAQANVDGAKGEVFSHLPITRRDGDDDRLAADGVSCAICHQITDRKLGTPESFSGGFVLDAPAPGAPRSIFGPFEIDKGRTRIMNSATELFKPTESAHVRQSELCATCHTLYTKALGPRGDVIGTLPEQVPYQEWRHSAYRDQRSCQSCHMPTVEEETRISSVLGEQRKGLARHSFRGGNVFMIRMLNRYRQELGVQALPQELESAARRTVQFLQSETAAVSIDRAAVAAGRLGFDVAVQNDAGHKLPTGYPSRRAWLYVTVRDRAGRALFESGAVEPGGAIQGNDHDADPQRFEPHHAEITRPDEVQVYESVMGDPAGRPTTGLLSAVRYLKDNRLLPRGFDKATAAPDIAVIGGAARDADFAGGSDRVRYSVDITGREGPFQIDVELRFQSIAYRWAQNLKQYDAAEPRRFVTFYDSMSHTSSEILARASSSTR